MSKTGPQDIFLGRLLSRISNALTSSPYACFVFLYHTEEVAQALILGPMTGQDCPLVEIVHFHDCLRGEVQSFLLGTRQLRELLGRDGWSDTSTTLYRQLQSQFEALHRVFSAHSKAEDDLIWPALRAKAGRAGEPVADTLEGTFEEDHHDEEGLFRAIEVLLAHLERCLAGSPEEASRIVMELEARARQSCEHLLEHLQKEEQQVLPLIQKYFTREEMAALVGTILGERPSELMNLILAMMFRNLSPESRADMLRHVKHAVDGTFFDRWLAYVRTAHQGTTIQHASQGFGEIGAMSGGAIQPPACNGGGQHGFSQPLALCDAEDLQGTMAMPCANLPARRDGCRMCGWVGRCPRSSPLDATDFESAVRNISRDGSLSMGDKTRAVQRLRAFAWAKTSPAPGITPVGGASSSMQLSTHLLRPPAQRLDDQGRVSTVDVPLVPVEDLAPSFTADGALGCRHYQRACKLRAECCNRLFSCRLCHDETVSGHHMDRYAVKDVLCMRCGTLQPVGKYCRSKECEGSNQPLGIYYCEICRLYENDTTKEIYHCPYCNVCRLGKGLGVDFRHCMTCNACVSLSISPTQHKCITQVLQGDCPVCHEALFNSIEHYKVLPGCGHSMHRHCYQAYRQTAYTCPLCSKSMEDMSAYFASLDLLLQAHPMPQEFATWRSKILCQDCHIRSEVPYHFCYHKCQGCGSYNTRVMSRQEE